MAKRDDMSRKLDRPLAGDPRIKIRGIRKGRKPKGEGGAMAPVEPDRPRRPLAGGAAAALEFDD